MNFKPRIKYVLQKQMTVIEREDVERKDPFSQHERGEEEMSVHTKSSKSDTVNKTESSSDYKESKFS